MLEAIAGSRRDASKPQGDARWQVVRGVLFTGVALDGDPATNFREHRLSADISTFAAVAHAMTHAIGKAGGAG